MYPISTPLDLMRLTLQTGMMLGQAQMVVGMRMLGMVGAWKVTPGENNRMVTEKIAASRESAMAAGRAIAGGKSPIVVAGAALKPYSTRTKSNVKRLARSGPGKP
jgi:hypothetical protein